MNKKFLSIMLIVTATSFQFATPVWARNINGEEINLNLYDNEIKVNVSTSEELINAMINPNSVGKKINIVKDIEFKNLSKDRIETLKNKVVLDGNGHTVNFGTTKFKIYNDITFNNVNIINKYDSNNALVLCENNANITLNNVKYNGGDFINNMNGNVYIKGKNIFNVISGQKFIRSFALSILDNASVETNSLSNNDSILYNVMMTLTIGSNSKFSINSENRNCTMISATNNSPSIFVGIKKDGEIKLNGSAKAAFSRCYIADIDNAILNIDIKDGYIFNSYNCYLNINGGKIKLASSKAIFNPECNTIIAINKGEKVIEGWKNTTDEKVSPDYIIKNPKGVITYKPNIGITTTDKNLINLNNVNNLKMLTFSEDLKVDKNALIKAINEKTNTNGMTPDSVKNYNDAIAAGQKVLDNPNATQDQVNDATKAIENAKAALTPDKSTLQNEIDKAKKALDNKNLTPDSKANLENALKEAEGVNGNDKATVPEISKATANLQNAINKLTNQADKGALKDNNSNTTSTARLRLPRTGENCIDTTLLGTIIALIGGFLSIFKKKK